MAARFREELQAALDKFDIRHAEEVVDKFHAAENDGYDSTAAEDKLMERLEKCIASYWRTAYSLD